MNDPEPLETLLSGLDQNGYDRVTSLSVYYAASKFIGKFDTDKDIATLDKLCRYLNWSLDQDKPELSYIACGFQKENVIAWIKHIKLIAFKCVESMSKLKPELQSDSKTLAVFLSTIVSLTSMGTWRITKLEEYKTLENGIHQLTNNVFSQILLEGNFYDNISTVLQAGYARPGKISFTKMNLYALATLANRPLLDPLFVSNLHLAAYITKVFSVPAYVHYVHSLCPDGLPTSLFPVIINFLAEEGELENCLRNMDVCFLLALLGNLSDFGQYYPFLEEIIYPKYITLLLKLLSTCQAELAACRKSHWHPILGWVSAPIQIPHLNTVNIVRQQLETLSKPVYIKACFRSLFEYADAIDEISQKQDVTQTKSLQPSTSKGFWKNGLMKLLKKVIPGETKRRKSLPLNSTSIVSDITSKVSLACSFYNNIITSITTFAFSWSLEVCDFRNQLAPPIFFCGRSKMDILTALCFKESSALLIALWKLLKDLSSENHIKQWVEMLVTPPHIQEDLILLFAEVITHYITVLDDQELYEDQKIFKLTTLIEISHFINNLCYRLLCHQSYTEVKDVTWTSLKTLLTVLHRRDSRRKFCPDGFWLIDSGKMNQLICDIDKGRKSAKRILLEMPHVIKEDARVIFFRKWSSSEKSLYTSSSSSLFDYRSRLLSPAALAAAVEQSIITVHRGRIVEDGYAQLSRLSPRELKCTIRVRFQNELGLDEAGIDQDGVFKEFIEETFAKVFNPAWNLFKSTSENLLYPSPLSYLQDKHLDLFEFVGKMLAKAVFEGIVVDVHFAPFFVTQLLGLQQNGMLFSVIDELQSFDRELYNSLIYIKHYDGDLKDLELTFSVDQEVLGTVRNVDLIAGGRAISVTNENKISYIYLKAHFHLYAQIKEQTAAFLRGFRYIIPNDWLQIFAPPEVQRLISGEDTDIDLGDLRRNTQYYGGFHDSHRVIVWLWDILAQEFTEQERRLFLKFVTSCSKPPLLGFSNLDPAFSVRCVEVSDDDDPGDTIGSVLRGFLTLGRQEPVGRLPTSSTCFNLLKLPNYNKKATLRDKLRYAISSNVGFELS